MVGLQRAQSFFILGLSLSITLAAVGCGDDASEETSGSGGSGASTSTSTRPEPVPSVEGFFDHRHTAVEDIPESCLAQLKSGSFVFHYAHRSHGAQLIQGAESLEASMPALGFEAEYCGVPAMGDVLKMWDGMISNNLVEAEHYWASGEGVADVRAILSENPSIKYSMWAWSFEISAQTEAQVQLYLDTMEALEAEFPDVTFIYMTGTAQDEYNAVNRSQRNAQIRAFAEQRGKVLYDFEDLDAWYQGERHTQVIDGVEVLREHPHYSVETAGNTEYEYTHTTQESCENKARAFWGMMAKLEGCAP